MQKKLFYRPTDLISGMILLGLILSWLPVHVLSQSRTALGWFYLVWYCLDSLLSCTVSVANCSGMILLGLILSWLLLILYCRELLWDDFTWSDIVLIDCYPVYWLSRALLWDDFTWSDIVLIPSYPVLSQSRTALGWFYLVWYCLDYLLSCTVSVANCSGMILLGLILSWFPHILYCRELLSDDFILGLILSWFRLILYCLSRKLLWDDFTWSDNVLITSYPVLSGTALGWFYLVWYCLDYLLSCTDSVANCSGIILLGLILSWFPRILYCRELLSDDFTWSDIVLITSYPVLLRTALGWFYLVWYCLDSLLSCSVANCSGMILLGLILSWLPLIL